MSFDMFSSAVVVSHNSCQDNTKYFQIEPHTISITLVHPVLVPRHMPATLYSAIFRVHTCTCANGGIFGHKPCVN